MTGTNCSVYSWKIRILVVEKGRFQRIVFERIPVDKVKKVISVPQSAITKDIHTHHGVLQGIRCPGNGKESPEVPEQQGVRKSFEVPSR